MHPLTFAGGALAGMGWAGCGALLIGSPMPWYFAIPLLVAGIGLVCFGIGLDRAERHSR